MEHAKWKNEILSASDIAKDYILEKSVREASNRGALRCPDPECQQPILKYCHGDIKEAYFSHKSHGACDYAVFDKETTPVVRTVQRLLFTHFQTAGLQVEQEIRLLPHHYTHLVITQDNGNKLAIEIGTQRTTLWHVQKIADQYSKQQIPVTWIIIGFPEETVEETHSCFIKRHQLNESETGDLFIINAEGDKIAQCRLDPNHYCLDGVEITSKNYPRVYQRMAPLGGLTVTNGQLEINGFNCVYENWLSRKKARFDEALKTMTAEAEDRKKLASQIEQEQRTQYRDSSSQYTVNTAKQPVPLMESYEERKQEILPRMNQTEEKVWDRAEQRWIRCKICGRIDVSSEFSKYGGPHEETLGVCRDCYIKSVKDSLSERKK